MNNNMSNTIQPKDIYELLQRFNNIDLKILKINLQYTCSKMYDKGEKPEFAQRTGLTTSQYYTAVNPAHSSKVTFDNFVTLCYNLNLDMYDLLTDHNRTERFNNQGRFWTYDNKQEFINHVSEFGITSTAEEYGLSEKTVMHYNKLFTNDVAYNA